MKKHFTIFLISAIIPLTAIDAQPSASFYFTTAFPVNDYQNIDDDLGYGGNLEFFFLSPTKPKPIGMGISFSYLGQGLYFYNDPCNCETFIGNNRANNFINANLILQVSPIDGPIKPYIETVFGGSYIFSYTELTTPYYYTDDLYIDDWAWTYGIGGGLKFLMCSFDDAGAIYLDLKGRYIMSSEVELLDRNSIRYANDMFYYSINETQLEYVAVQIGLVFNF